MDKGRLGRRRIFGIEFIEILVEDDSVLDILESISKEIQVVIDRVDEYSRGVQEPDAYVDSECEKIEALLGVAFLICQVYINSVADNVIRILSKDLKSALQNIPDKKWAMLDTAPPISDTISVSKVRAIYEAANFFKHRDEWPLNWDDVLVDEPTKAQEFTQEIMRQLGCMAGSNANLRTVSELLGNTNYADLERIKHVVRNWGANILNEFKSALEHVRNSDEQKND